MLNYITTLNLVRLGTQHKLKYIKIPKNNKSTKILFILLKYNVISGWSLCKNKTAWNYLVYCNNTNLKIHTLIKKSKKLNIKYKYIKILMKNYKSSTIFLSTPKGFLSITEAYKKKTGGFLFFRLI